MNTPTFEAFGFAEPLARALTQCGYEKPTPIQALALKPQLESRDLLGMAETGSGKTATFILPILQRLAAEPVDPLPKQVFALVLAPTRELAIQIDQEVASLSRNMRVRRAVVLGGVSKGPQINALKRGVHVLVATPGRLLDHVNMRTCDLSHVRVLVLDEADRMFDMGFIRDIRKIVSLIPSSRRTALFSATMPDEIRKFAYEVLKDPHKVDLSTKTVVVDRIDQKAMIVRTPEKQSRLHTLLADPEAKRVIVFTRTKRGADRVSQRLESAGISSSAFHGNKAQNARQRALNDFTQGHIRVLVATDIAARGIDVSNITHVINFDMPVDPETYVHRVGRTARKGTSGIAISLCDPSERKEIVAIERMMKQRLEIIDDVGGASLPPLERKPREASRSPRPDRGRPDHRNGEGAGHRNGGGARPERHARPEYQPRKDDAAIFGVGSASEPAQAHREPRRDRGDRPQGAPHHRGERPHRGQHTRGERGNSERSGEQRPIRFADPSQRDKPRNDGNGQRHRDHADASASAGKTGGRDAARSPSDRPHRDGNEGGKGAWAAAGAPKFMRRRNDDRGRGRADRNPA
ncbi:DEAD/DEAH box helicase [Hyphomicrobium methylovorum]|uniref:DEAD/DEAH box helicase n=1 Tax=Hyphomicrobium methylovorum TaxID=84 RepID=UPI001FE9CBA5|nr:DEAD/DEAH box helicase [Hyphomicrobium methylovorum]